MQIKLNHYDEPLHEPKEQIQNTHTKIRILRLLDGNIVGIILSKRRQ